MGKLEVIVGPMYAGKTEELIRRIRRSVYAKQQCVNLKHSFDVRYSQNDIITHDGQKIQCFGAQNAKELSYVCEQHGNNAEVIAIDEIQFFDAGIVDVIRKLVALKKRVIVAGLDMDYTGAPFGKVPELMAIADEATKLKAVCSICGSDAMFSKRLVRDTDCVLVGSKDKYIAVCREHFR